MTRSSFFLALALVAPLTTAARAQLASAPTAGVPGSSPPGARASSSAPGGSPSGSAPTGTRGASTTTSGAATASRGAAVGGSGTSPGAAGTTGTSSATSAASGVTPSAGVTPGAAVAASSTSTGSTSSTTSSSAGLTFGQPVALASALGVAQTGSFSIGSAQARIQAAQARLRAAGASPGITLTLARAFGSHNTAGFDEDIILSQVIELGKRGSRVRGAGADLAAAQFGRAGVLNDLQFALRSAYFDALRADVERDLANDALMRALTFQNAAQTQLVAGDVPRANVVRSSIEVSRARATLASTQSDRRVRYATLRSLLALPEDAPLSLSDQLTFTPATYNLDALQQLALAQRPDLQSARSTLQSRQAAVQAARALGRPDAFVEARRAGLTKYAGTPNGTSLRVGFVIPLFDFGRNRAGAEEARANVLDQQGTLVQTLRAVRLDVATTYEKFVAAQVAVQGFDAGRLAQSKELLSMAQIGYARGANSYLELLDAQTVYRTEQADYARALAAWNTARADLERAVGGTLP